MVSVSGVAESSSAPLIALVFPPCRSFAYLAVECSCGQFEQAFSQLADSLLGRPADQGLVDFRS
jgi:hypothetical protein